MIARAFYFLLWCVLRLWAAFRPSDVIVLDGVPYMRRYYLRGTPGGDGPSVRLQHILRADPDRGLHDHPWHAARSLVLRGGYTETRQRRYRPPYDDTLGYVSLLRTRDYGPGARNTLVSGHAFADYHRITAVRPGGAWTLFRTSEHHGRGWGFK